MDSGGQLRLLLWKDYIVRKRHPGVIAIVFGWALVVFMCLYVVRVSEQPKLQKTCQYRARALPSVGLLPFVQSFICNIDNRCEDIADYEHIPQYKEAKLGPVIHGIEKLFNNDSVVNLFYNIPNIVQVFTGVGTAVKDGSDLSKLFKTGIQVSELFSEPEIVKEKLIQEKLFSVQTVNTIFNASVNYGYVLQIFTSTDFEATICQPEKFAKFLIVENSSDLVLVSKDLCKLDTSVVPNMLQNLIGHANFENVFEKIGNVMGSFMNYDFFKDAQTFIRKILELNSVKTSVPHSVQLHQWVPKIVPLFKNVKENVTDFSFIHKALDEIEPTFVDRWEWRPIRKIISSFATLISWFNERSLQINNEIQLNNKTLPENITLLAIHIDKEIREATSEKGLQKFDGFLKKIDGIFKNDSNWEPLYQFANILDGMLPFLPKNVSSILEQFPVFYNNFMIVAQHAIRLNNEGENVLYEYLKNDTNHLSAVESFMRMDSEVLKSMLLCLHNAHCTMNLITESKNPANFYCNLNKLETVFTAKYAVQVKGSLCENKNWYDFVSFALKTIDLNTTVNALFSNNEYSYKNTNFNSAVRLTKYLIDSITSYKVLENNKHDWKAIINSDKSREELLSKAKAFHKIYLLNVQLPMLKEYFENNVELKPFKELSIVLDELTKEISLIPLPLVLQIKRHYQSLIETLLLTLNDKAKIFKLTSVSNWRENYCDGKQLDLINYPENVSSDDIHDIICEMDAVLKMKLKRYGIYNPFIIPIKDVFYGNATNTSTDFSTLVDSFQGFTATLSSFFEDSFAEYDWSLSKKLYSRLVENWHDLVNFETGFQISAHIGTRLLQFYDIAIFGVGNEREWFKEKNVLQTVDKVIAIVNEIAELSLLVNVNDSVADISDINMDLIRYAKNLPQILTSVIYSLDNSTQLKNSTKLTNWLKEPCKLEIVESALDKQFIELINNTICKGSNFVNRPLSGNNSFEIWSLYESTKKSTPDWNDKLRSTYDRLKRETGGKTVEETFAISKSEKQTLLNANIIKLQDALLGFINKEINPMKAVSLNDILSSYENCTTKHSVKVCNEMYYNIKGYFTKYLSKALSVVSFQARQYLSLLKGTEISSLEIMGFTKQSGPTILYNKFGDLIVTLVHSYQKPEFEQKILGKLSESKTPKCEEIVNSIELPENSSMTLKELQSVKNYLCPKIFDVPVMNDNLFLQTVSLLQNIFLDEDVHKYNVNYNELLDNVLALKEHVKAISKVTPLKINPLFDDKWLEYTKRSLSALLEYEFKSNSTFTRFFKYIRLNSSSDSLVDGFRFIGSSQHATKYIKTQLERLSAQNEAKTIDNKDLVAVVDAYDFYPKDVVGILFYAYFIHSDDTANQGFVKGFQELCLKSSSNVTLNYLPPEWILADSRGVLKRLCKIENIKNIESEIFPKADESSVVFPLNVEGVIIDFAKLLLNMLEYKSGITFNAVNSLNRFDDLFKKGALSEEEIKNASRSMVNYYVDTYSVKRMQQIDTQIFIRTFALKLFRGGNWWQTLVEGLREYPTLHRLLMIAEQVPTLPLSIVEAATSPNLMYDFTAQYVHKGTEALCDVDFDEFEEHTNVLMLIQSVACAWRKNKIIMELLTNRIAVSKDDTTMGSYNKTILENHIFDMNNAYNDLTTNGIDEFVVPDWMIPANIEKAYNDYAIKTRTPIIMLQTVTSSMTQLFDIGSLFYKNESSHCKWCTGATILVQQVKKHSSLAQKYIDLMCKIPKMTLKQIYDTFKKDFTLDDFTSQLNSTKQYTVDDFNTELHGFVDVFRTQAIAFSTNATAKKLAAECPKNLAKGFKQNGPFSLQPYIEVAVEMIKLVKSSSSRFAEIEEVRTYFEKIAHSVEINMRLYKPISEILLKSNMSGFHPVQDALLHSKVDVNYIYNRAFEEFSSLNESEFGRVFKINDSKQQKELYKAYSADKTFSKTLLKDLNVPLIKDNIDIWRKNAAWDFKWLEQIFEEFEHILLNGGSLLDIASKVNLQSISASTFSAPDVLDGIVTLIQQRKIDKLFVALRSLIFDITPLIQNQTITNDLHIGLDALESMELFVNLNLMRMEYKMSDLFINWPNEREYFISEIKLQPHVVDTLMKSDLDLISVVASQKNLLTLRDTVCDPKQVIKLFQFYKDDVQVSSKILSDALCNLKANNMKHIFGLIFSSIEFPVVMKKLSDSGVANILSISNVSAADGKSVISSLTNAVHLLPEIRSTFSNISADFSLFSSADGKKKKNKPKSLPLGLAADGNFLSKTGKLLCGRQIIPESGKVFKIIAEAIDNAKSEEYDSELNSFQTPFCKTLYKEILNMPGGKILWTFIKPYIKGQILFTPDTEVVRNILVHANGTFGEIDRFAKILSAMSQGLNKISSTKNINQLMKSLEKFMESPIIKLVLQSVTGKGFSLKELSLSKLTNQLGNSDQLRKVVTLGADFLECVSVDRFVGFPTEELLELEANKLLKSHEFMAGVVFLDENLHRHKRDVDYHNISYKIRMDLGNVPMTSQMKYPFWEPGPQDDFLNELQYFRGFVQLQDMLDRAIMKMSSVELPKWDTYSQQMPYPCWKRDFFKTMISYAQSLQACFFFGMIVFVAASVRYLVWEKETNNMLLMHVMGMKYWAHNLSWILISILEGIFAVIIIYSILEVGGILVITNRLLLNILMVEYAISIVAFCYMISNIFTSASLAAVASVILYLVSYMPFIIVIGLEAHLTFIHKILTSLSMSSSFCYGCLHLMRYEVQGTGLDWNNMWESPLPGDEMNFGYAMLMLAFDSILYFFIGGTVAAYLRSEVKSNLNLDAVNNYTVNEEAPKVGVNISNLSKIFRINKQDFKALDNINIQMYTGQVTTLLGHNGAGKTTLIKILTGMLQQSKGEITINNSIKEKCIPGYQYIGVCTQNSVLIESLTAREHLLFYAQIKTQENANAVLPDVLNMLDTMNFGNLAQEPVSHLSEGMRRRLCIGIAFIGKPTLVVLDEPSSGVDPIARRQLWELISRHKEGRTVLLTTHHLDEAEVLSDRIVILHKGKVLCSGTPLSLKHDYGSGYDVTVNYTHLSKLIIEKDDLMNTVKQVAPNATFSSMSNREIQVTVPFLSNTGVATNFEELASTLENAQQRLGFSYFAMNCTTLEQTFMSLCKDADEASAKNANNLTDFSELIVNTHIDDISLENGDSKVFQNFDENLSGKFRDKLKALLRKRFLHYSKDWRILICAFFLPTVFTAIAMGFSLIRPPSVDEPMIKLSPELYFPHSTLFLSDYNNYTSNYFLNTVKDELLKESYDGTSVPFTKVDRNCMCLSDGSHHCEKPSKRYYNTVVKFSSVNETVDWLLDSQDEYIEKRYGGWSLADMKYENKSDFVVWYNNKGFHSMPGYLNTLNNAILRATHKSAAITTYSHPIKLSGERLTSRSLAQHVADVGIASIILIAFSLIPASGAIYLVQERTNQEKRVQILCGVSPLLYWMVALLWDLLMLIGAILLAVCVFEIFGLPIYVARLNLPAICLLLSLYGWACIPMVHVLQRFFTDTSMANMTLFCTSVFIGMTQLTSILLMDILGRTQMVEDMRNIVHDIFLIFPQFCLADGLIEISKNNIKASLLSRFNIDVYENPLGWKLMGLHYTYLAIMGLLFFIVNIILETRWYERPKKYKLIHKVNDDSLEMIALRKEFNSFNGTKVAVNALSMLVPNGECLGLIGVNGAGKSTTFKMLTGELSPTSGTIRIQGQDVREGILYTGIVGYCPQKDSLDPKLTVYEILETYGTLRGISKLNLAIKDIMVRFGLSIYENSRVENLSGGNKRKLCAAISVLGNTSLILMDEPTSGMDPKSRAIVAREVKRLVKENKAIILTSHSMEECEKLCTKVAILVNGNLVCQGTPSELKNKLGAGYILNIRLANSDQQGKFHDRVLKEFIGSKLQSCHYCSSQFLIPTQNVSLSDIFKGIVALTQSFPIQDYTLFQSTLDQVFITLASSENDNNCFVNDEGKVSNECYSMGPV